MLDAGRCLGLAARDTDQSVQRAQCDPIVGGVHHCFIAWLGLWFPQCPPCSSLACVYSHGSGWRGCLLISTLIGAESLIFLGSHLDQVAERYGQELARLAGGLPVQHSEPDGFPVHIFAWNRNATECSARRMSPPGKIPIYRIPTAVMPSTAIVVGARRGIGCAPFGSRMYMSMTTRV